MKTALAILGFTLVVAGWMIYLIRWNISFMRNKFGPAEEIPNDDRRFELRSTVIGLFIFIVGMVLVGYGFSD